MIRKGFYMLLVFVISWSLSAFPQTFVSEFSNVFDAKKNNNSHQEKEFIHSPKKATILSIFVPGGGQIYNNKFWKVPVIWIGMGTALYFSQDYRKEYLFWKNEYIKYVDISSENQMLTYKQWMETSYIVMGAIYVLQILDANVDAHLMSFDVSDDLSLNIRPDAQWNMALNKPTCGLTLKLGFK